MEEQIFFVYWAIKYKILRWALDTSNLEFYRHIQFVCESHHLMGCWYRDRMVVGFTTTYAISAYYHWCCEFESRSGLGVQHYVIKFVSDLRQIGGFLQVLWFPPLIKLTPQYNWNIAESGIKHHQTNIIWNITFLSLWCQSKKSTTDNKT